MSLFTGVYKAMHLFILTVKPVSSRISRMTASSGDSCGSTPPPGSTQTGTSRLLTRSTSVFSFIKMTPITLLISFFCICLLGGCYKDNLYVQQEWVDGSFLASSKVCSPDPRQSHPPIGQRLIIGWDFPKSLFQEGLTLVATVRLWDNSQQEFRKAITRKREVIEYFFQNDQEGIDLRILTYKIQILGPDGKEVRVWEHHLWTELIDLDKRSSADKTSS